MRRRPTLAHREDEPGTLDSVSDTTASELAGVLTPEGYRLLNELWRSGDYSTTEPLKGFTERLSRTGHEPAVVSPVLTQLEVTDRRGVEVRGRSVTDQIAVHGRRSSQQATPAGRLAAHHARRFALAPWVDEVSADLGSGLGARP